MQYSLPLDISLRNEPLISEVMDKTVKFPTARVAIQPDSGAWLDPAPFTNFEFTQKGNGSIDSFNLILANTSWWDVKAVNKSWRCKFYATFAGVEMLLFEGVPIERVEAWPQPSPAAEIRPGTFTKGQVGASAKGWSGGDDPITIRGYGLFGLLKLIDGTYMSPYGEQIPYSGSLMHLISWFHDKVGTYALMDAPDDLEENAAWREVEALDLNYSDGVAAVKGIAASMWPAGTIFTDRHGTTRYMSRMKNPPAAEFYYSDVFDSSNPGKPRIHSMERAFDLTGVITRCMVIYSDGAVVRDASSAIKSKYGIRKHTANLPYLESEYEANMAADAIIEESLKWKVKLIASLNPYLTVGSVINLHPRMADSPGPKKVEVIERNVRINNEGNITETLTCKALEEGQGWE